MIVEKMPFGAIAAPVAGVEYDEQSREYVVQKGKEIYEQVRAQLDTPENQGKCVIVEVDTGEYEIVEETQLAYALHARGPSTRRFLVRVGSETFFHRRSPRRRHTIL